MTRAQLDFLQSRRDQPNGYPYWGGTSGSGGARVRMAEQLERDGYLNWPEDSDFGWQITDKGRDALAKAGRGEEGDHGR